MINKTLEVVITVDGKSYLTEDSVPWPQNLAEAAELLGETEALEYFLAGYGNNRRGRIRTQWLAENKPAAAAKKATADRVPLKHTTTTPVVETKQRTAPRRLAAGANR